MSVVASASVIVSGHEQEAGSFCCAACGRRQVRRRPVLRGDATRRPFDLLRCAECGLVQQQPLDPGAPVAGLDGEDLNAFAEEETCRWAGAAQRYAVHVGRWETSRYRRLLDLGCGLGHFSAVAERCGWRVVGLDLSPQAVGEAAVRFGLDFRAGSLGRHRDALPPFDLVFLGGIIEKVREPADLLGDVHRLLAPGGVVCIDTPNWGSTWRRWGRGHWVGLGRAHLNLFDADSLTGLLQWCGFAAIQTGSYTPYRYESWADRPEPQAVVRRMPALLAKRINRFFAARGRRKPWAPLREDPPATLDETVAWLRGWASCRHGPDTSRRSGDMLVATARRG
jgi:SAM-dependent methyltransferase